MKKGTTILLIALTRLFTTYIPPSRIRYKVSIPKFNRPGTFFTPQLAFHEPPFRCTNEGWGEFEMTIECFTTEKSGKSTLIHDLNFSASTYENVHTVTFRNPSQALQQVLRDTGPLPSEEDGAKSKNRKLQDAKKKKGVDVEKMAEALTKLSEDDLLVVIQLIHDNKTDETYIKNDVDGIWSLDNSL